MRITGQKPTVYKRGAPMKYDARLAPMYVWSKKPSTFPDHARLSIEYLETDHNVVTSHEIFESALPEWIVDSILKMHNYPQKACYP